MLVLRGHEAARHFGEAEPSEPEERAVHREREARTSQDAPDHADVAVGCRIEEAIERAKQPAERAIEQARGQIFWRTVRMQEHGGERGAERERIERGNHGGDRDRDRELPIKLPGQARDEADRDEHRAQHERDRDDRTAHLVHRFARGVTRRKSERDVALDVLDDDDRIVHDDADRQHQTEERERVDREAEQVHHRERAHQ